MGYINVQGDKKMNYLLIKDASQSTRITCNTFVGQKDKVIVVENIPDNRPKLNSIKIMINFP